SLRTLRPLRSCHTLWTRRPLLTLWSRTTHRRHQSPYSGKLVRLLGDIESRGYVGRAVKCGDVIGEGEPNAWVPDSPEVKNLPHHGPGRSGYRRGRVVICNCGYVARAIICSDVIGVVARARAPSAGEVKTLPRQPIRPIRPIDPWCSRLRPRGSRE